MANDSQRVSQTVCAVVVALALTGCGRDLGPEAEDAMRQLHDGVPWSASVLQDYSDVCSHVEDLLMCGPYLLKVEATESDALSALPAVLQRIGFGNRVRTEGCVDCPGKPTVIGVNEKGRRLAITVYPEGDQQAVLDAYLSESDH